MILVVTLLLLFCFVAIPVYFGSEVRGRLPLGGERELFWITLGLAAFLGGWLITGQGVALIDRTALAQLEAFQLLRENHAACDAVWHQNPVLLVQSLPICLGSADLAAPFIVTVTCWVVLLMAVFIAAAAVSGVMAGAFAVLAVLFDQSAREPFSALGPTPVVLAVVAVVLAAFVAASTPLQRWMGVLLCFLVGLLIYTVDASQVVGVPAAEPLRYVVPLVLVAFVTSYLLRFFTRDLRTRYIESGAACRAGLVLIAATSLVAYALFHSNGVVSSLVYCALLLSTAVAAAAALAGFMRFMRVHPIAAPLAVLGGVVAAFFFSPPSRPHAPGVVTLATDLAAVAPAGSVVGSAVSPGLLREFLLGRELVTYAELARRVQSGEARLWFVETRFATAEQLSVLRANAQLDSVLPGIYRVQPVAATSP